MRNKILRERKYKEEDCVFDGDELEGAFHLGYFMDDELVCVISFHPEDKISNKYTSTIGGYQLRELATVEEFRRKGIAN